MNSKKIPFAISLIGLFFFHGLFAQKPIPEYDHPEVQHRSGCNPPQAQTDLAVNNIRARLLTGGDLWWDGESGRYIAPKESDGTPEVSALFAAGIWVGGVDPAGNLKIAAQTYGRADGAFDFWPGPLNDGIADEESCTNWDRFFKVTSEEIDTHRDNAWQCQMDGVLYDPASIPSGVKGWPARGNPYFTEIYGFDLPFDSRGLAEFFDWDGDGMYEPQNGDYPQYTTRGFDLNYADEMVFWIFNDMGNVHASSMGDPIQMEIQATAFAFATEDEFNDMTFYKYKMINRAIESIDSTYFALWVDPDLGCYTDDYFGFDSLRNMSFIYNADAIDGNADCSCPQGIPTYCEEIPMLGIDFIYGPITENGHIADVSSFTYYGSPAPALSFPQTSYDYYNYISGSKKDGTPFTYGGAGYGGTEPTKYVFTGEPCDPNGWSMTGNLPSEDYKFIQSTGPMRLDPGAVNEVMMGVYYVPDQHHPCPSIKRLQKVSDKAQHFFESSICTLGSGPDCPDLDFVELDRELILLISNDTVTSNNAYETFSEPAKLPFLYPYAENELYHFEGYKIYQLAGQDVNYSDLNDPDKARLIFQTDIKNGIAKIFNWNSELLPNTGLVYLPELMVDGQDKGIRHAFRITEDAFAEGDQKLVNHKRYYFAGVSYAHNEYEPFNPQELTGQEMTYLQSIRNFGDGVNGNYTAIPRPVIDRKLNASFEESVEIIRLEGVGAGGNFLDISDQTREAILSGTFDGEITYKASEGPFNVRIINPLEVKDGLFELTFFDNDLSDDILHSPSTKWRLVDLNNPTSPIFSDLTIERLNEQIITEYGFSISVKQTKDAGDVTSDKKGVIGYEEVYKDVENTQWFRGIPDGFPAGSEQLGTQIFNFIATDQGEEDASLDPVKELSTIGEGYFVPYVMCNWRSQGVNGSPYITPAWEHPLNSVVRNHNKFADLNNVDIVLTSDKNKWSRCVVIETASDLYIDEGALTMGGLESFDLRASRNVTKFDDNNDGLPDVDTNDPGEGMGWFPGYAIDVETGQRLNIFFGENSWFSCEMFTQVFGDSIACQVFDDPYNRGVGGDMMWNPTSQLNLGSPNILNFITGGQHFIYVTKTPYDECAPFRNYFDSTRGSITKVNGIKEITWTGIPMAEEGTQLLSYRDGLIPNDLTIKLRVDNPFSVYEGTGEFNGYPSYRFEIKGMEPSQLNQEETNEALKMVNVVPNPYRGLFVKNLANYTDRVLITNLPAKCTVTIYTLDGKFVRQFQRDEVTVIPDGNNRAILQKQIIPDLEWDLKNKHGVPIGAGVYLIHVDAAGLGERILKWFGTP